MNTLAPVNADFTRLLKEFKDWQSGAFAEMRRLSAECDRAEATCLAVVQSWHS
jgi:hypothetical protein